MSFLRAKNPGLGLRWCLPCPQGQGFLLMIKGDRLRQQPPTSSKTPETLLRRLVLKEKGSQFFKCTKCLGYDLLIMSGTRSGMT